ncbi:MAG TPA: P1 family peptidase, partial [Gemmatimonadales bacterium]|nr:P1 family peptidase [Gemmatimonadales bacterium]
MSGRARTAWALLPVVLTLLLAPPEPGVAQQARPRARDLGIPFPGEPGPHNAITDVAGVTVGQVTLVTGSGNLVEGKGPVRTGVTLVNPRGGEWSHAVYAAWHTLNGNGEMTGTTWIEESGTFAGPVAITNTHSVGVVRDAIVQLHHEKDPGQIFGLPVVAETFDGGLNDVNGHHVKPEHVRQAVARSTTGRVAEGNVGGGTGMICHWFKGGIGTSSRKVSARAGGYTVGVLVQCNYGSRRRMAVLGAPVGEELRQPLPCYPAGQHITEAYMRGLPSCGGEQGALESPTREGLGSIIVIVATDAPLLPHQLRKLAKRVSLGLGRDGGLGENSSGDIFLAFSTMP